MKQCDITGFSKIHLPAFLMLYRANNSKPTNAAAAAATAAAALYKCLYLQCESEC
jgi:hypothetical protein